MRCPACGAWTDLARGKQGAYYTCADCGHPFGTDGELQGIISCCRESCAYAHTRADKEKILVTLASISGECPDAEAYMGILASDMGDIMPEKGRWQRLANAFLRGSTAAQEQLERDCSFQAGRCARTSCKLCGGPRYYSIFDRTPTPCVYCVQAGAADAEEKKQ